MRAYDARMDSLRLLALSGVVLLGVGCRNSTHELHVKGQTIVVGEPRALPFGSIPVAVSRDGSRLALVDNAQHLGEDLDGVDIRVVDTQTLETVGQKISFEDPTGIAFDASGSRLFMGRDEKYVAWDYKSGSLTPVLDEVPKVGSFPPDALINYDHSILVSYPGGYSKPGATEGTPGTALVNGHPFSIPFTHKLGFDEFGDFWYQASGRWTKIDRAGRLTVSAVKPRTLVGDQTKARGQMHLEFTRTEMRYKDAKAYIQALWLTHDHPVPDPTNPQMAYQAALVFAGSDVFEYGFVPNQPMVYVVTGTGSYLVSYSFESDAERAKKRRRDSGGVGRSRG